MNHLDLNPDEWRSLLSASKLKAHQGQTPQVRAFWFQIVSKIETYLYPEHRRSHAEK